MFGLFKKAKSPTINEKAIKFASIVVICFNSYLEEFQNDFLKMEEIDGITEKTLILENIDTDPMTFMLYCNAVMDEFTSQMNSDPSIGETLRKKINFDSNFAKHCQEFGLTNYL